MKHTIQALIEAERERQHRRVQGAETELKHLRSQPIPGPDGDEDGGRSPKLQRARQVDRVEAELDRARAAAQALQALWVRVEEETATEQDDQMVKAMP